MVNRREFRFVSGETAELTGSRSFKFAASGAFALWDGGTEKLVCRKPEALASRQTPTARQAARAKGTFISLQNRSLAVEATRFCTELRIASVAKGITVPAGIPASR